MEVKRVLGTISCLLDCGGIRYKICEVDQVVAMVAKEIDREKRLCCGVTDGRRGFWSLG